VRFTWAAAIALLVAAVLAAIALPAPAATTGAPAFVQQVNKRVVATNLTLQPTANVTTGNRLVVQVGLWSASNSSASNVTDSAGNTYTKLTSFKASENTELSIWTAPITAGGGTRPTVTVTANRSADIGATVLEYSGLSTAAGAAAVDKMAQATASTGGSAANVSAGPTAPTTAAGELAIGFYNDSGFGNTLAGDPTYTTRTNVSPTGDMEFLVQDQLLTGTGATPNPTTATGPNTPWQAATVVFKTAAPAPPPTAPATPTAPSASAGDGQATVTWTAPDDGGATITKYTVTPYIGSTAQTPKDVTGNPAATSTTVTGLTNGTAYTFKVSATNSVGTSADSAASNSVTPVQPPPSTLAFVQQVNKRAVTANLTLVPASNVATGNRLIVEAGVWSAGNASASSVTDSAGNTYTKLTSFKASENTELSVWTAPITAGGGTKPTISVKTTSSADIGAAVLEYSGLSSAAGTGAVDQLKTATGKTSAASAVSSGPTAASTAAGELAIGFYNDSGFGATLAGDPGYTTRTNVSPTSDMEFLVQDRILPNAGTTANPTTSTGANTVWEAATVIFKTSAPPAPSPPNAPGGVTATPGNGQATVSWTAPYDGGSQITKYTVTPYIGSNAQTPTEVTGSPPAATATVTGLVNNTTYTFTVTATNANGTSPPSLGSNAVTPGSSPQGQWSALMNWPLVAVHSVLLKNGNLVVWDGWANPQPTSVWSATSQTFPTTINAPGSIFCGANVHLPDGRILTAGGDGIFTTGTLGLADTAIFDPATSTWKRVADMNRPRWYPSLTELQDGRYVAISGNSTNDRTWADTPEVYDPVADTWTLINGVSTPQVHEVEYPFSYLVPNGKVFTIGPSEDNSFFLDVDNQTWTPVGGTSGVVNGSSVMYRPGKILYSGGAPTINTPSTAKATTAVIDLTASTPAWRQTPAMRNSRIYHTLTMLADGTVLALGGEQSSDQSIVTSGVLPAEIWDPVTETWTSVAPMAAARNYHSTAVLMPDGRVLVAGGGHYINGTGPGQFSAQIYSPPYLFNGSRPTISNAPAAATYGSDITITTPNAASIRKVSLVSLAADTHQSDMDQHFVPLDYTAGSGSLTVQAPANASLAPPGTYMLFIVDDQGVPSVASMVSMSRTLTAPATPSAPTASAGDGQATVNWTAPDDGGSAITKYTVTPYIGSTALTPKDVTGNPAATSTTISGLTNGTAYTFKVKATNAVGSSAESPASNSVTPAPPVASPLAFVQQVNKRVTAVTNALQPTANVTTGNRLIVLTGIWSAGKATASTVTDSAGNTYTKLTAIKASEDTELTVWSAPITVGGGTRPTITVRATGSADIGASVLEYSGLSAAAGAAVVDQLKTATGKTTVAGNVSSGATAASTAAGELAMGFYVDSGFSNALTGDSTYTVRTNVSPTVDMELLAQDRVLTSSGTTANPVTRTGANTPWLAATIVFKVAAPPAQAQVQGLARSVALTTASDGPAGTPITADAAPVAPEQRVYAFTAVTPKAANDAASLLFCPLPIITVGLS
jgi:Galactose oxidase-like, Early set domain/Fibronectin type III domain